MSDDHTPKERKSNSNLAIGIAIGIAIGAALGGAWNAFEGDKKE